MKEKIFFSLWIVLPFDCVSFFYRKKICYFNLWIILKFGFVIFEFLWIILDFDCIIYGYDFFSSSLFIGFEFGREWTGFLQSNVSNSIIDGSYIDGVE